MPAAGDYHIRLIRESDLESLNDLEQSIFEKIGYPFFVLRQLLDVHRSHWLVAERNGDICGYALSAPSSESDEGWLLGLAVHPDHRRLGIGKALLSQSLELMRRRGIRRAYLTVKPESEALIELYRLAGFSVEDFVPDYLGPGEHRLVMATSLDHY